MRQVADAAAGLTPMPIIQHAPGGVCRLTPARANNEPIMNVMVPTHNDDRPAPKTNISSLFPTPLACSSFITETDWGEIPKAKYRFCFCAWGRPLSVSRPVTCLWPRAASPFYRRGAWSTARRAGRSQSEAARWRPAVAGGRKANSLLRRIASGPSDVAASQV